MDHIVHVRMHSHANNGSTPQRYTFAGLFFAYAKSVRAKIYGINGLYDRHIEALTIDSMCRKQFMNSTFYKVGIFFLEKSRMSHAFKVRVLLNKIQKSLL